ncbi:AAA family ATPase [Desulforhopalus vacuolatus]|uniref:ParA family protein n=1 Tax=Desulforhopalus vacuolatus TaxID=40414 RepID=UPI001966146B|nr:AAA family ATPase [Desulforhopalus vacuolatus]MBM9519554.1 AAA family ATPase [Desulforhopalus vacuolatus]
MKILACYSNKGGVGKTASSVNLAYACAMSGRKTLLCDLDPQGASGFYFRVKPSKKLQDLSFFKDQEKFLDSIRASDFENLELLPANMSFKDFDIFLDRMKKSSSRLKKALKVTRSEYDVVILDCPPNISMLSENVFRAADLIVVPVIPTTLSARTLEQLYAFFKEQGFSQKKLLPFFSMVQMNKKLHRETIEALRKEYKMLKPQVPFSTDVERMGVNRAPVATFAPKSAASDACQAVWKELETYL